MPRHRGCRKSKHVFTAYVIYSSKWNNVSVKKTVCDKCGIRMFTWTDGTHTAFGESINELVTYIPDQHMVA